jgi:hypothetical protein
MNNNSKASRDNNKYSLFVPSVLPEEFHFFGGSTFWGTGVLCSGTFGGSGFEGSILKVTIGDLTGVIFGGSSWTIFTVGGVCVAEFIALMRSINIGRAEAMGSSIL